MPNFVATLLFLSLATAAFERVESIKCYVCRSDENKDCAGNPPSGLARACPLRPGSNGAYCRKIEQQLYFRNEKDVTTIRECAYEKNPKQCYKSKWSSAAYLLACECEEDLCNGSTRPVPASLTGFGGSLLGALVLGFIVNLLV